MDFDLSQALEGPVDSDEVGFKSRCLDNTDVADELIAIDEGLELLVSCNKATIKKVANLVVAAARWTTLTKLRDAQLCSFVMENLVEETAVDGASGSRQTLCSFNRMDSENELSLCDVDHKTVTFKSEELTLQAVTLKGGHDSRRVNFNMAKYGPQGDANTLAIVLSIKNSNWHISCSMQGDKAVLSLEMCSKESLKEIRDESMKRYLFYKRPQGISQTRFESVNCSGWFISTSYDEENQPVEMCRNASSHRILNFRMK